MQHGSHIHLVSKFMSELNAIRSKESFSECNDWTLGDWGNAVAGECGEMCNFIKKHRRGNPLDVEAVGKEIADTFFYLDHILTIIGLDWDTVLRQKFNEVSDRKGSDKKL